MKKLLIVLLAALLWTIPSALMAQVEHDHDHEHEQQPAQSETGLDHDCDEHGHDHEAADTVEGESVHHGAEDHDDHEGHKEEGVVEVSPEGMKLAGITMAKVSRGQIGKSIDLPGEVGFDEDHLVHVAPRFAGIAKEARCRVGDYVTAGDVMAVIESNESLSSYPIEASISGWVIKRHITPGEYVCEENTIYVIADLSHVWVNLAVYPKDAEQIKPGLKALIRAIGSETQTIGTIEYVTPILDVETRRITARVVLPNPNHTWRPGTFVYAEVATDPGEEGLVVAKSAVQILGDEHVVFVPEGVGRFEPVLVEIGDSDSLYTKIQSGLEWGTEYVVTGAFELKAKIVTSALGGHAGHGH